MLEVNAIVQKGLHFISKQDLNTDYNFNFFCSETGPHTAARYMSVCVFRWGMRWHLDENTGAGWVTGSLAWMFRAGGFHHQHCFTAGSHPPLSLPPSLNSALLSTLPFLFSNCCIGDLSSHAETKVWCHLTAFHKQN